MPWVFVLSRFTGVYLVLSGVRKGCFPKGWFWRRFPSTKNRNEGTCGCSLVPKNRTRAHADVPWYPKPERGHIRQNRPFPKPPPFVSSRFWSVSDKSGASLFLPCSHKNAVAHIVSLIPLQIHGEPSIGNLIWHQILVESMQISSIVASFCVTSLGQEDHIDQETATTDLIHMHWPHS